MEETMIKRKVAFAEDISELHSEIRSLQKQYEDLSGKYSDMLDHCEDWSMRLEQLEIGAKTTNEIVHRIVESEAETYAELAMHLMEHKLRSNLFYRLRKLDERWLDT